VNKSRAQHFQLRFASSRTTGEFENFKKSEGCANGQRSLDGEYALFPQNYRPGDTMPVAWNDLCPQIPGLDHLDSPESIFFAGRSGVRLLT
jgi:hypothetical protein